MNHIYILQHDALAKVMSFNLLKSKPLGPIEVLTKKHTDQKNALTIFHNHE